MSIPTPAPNRPAPDTAPAPPPPPPAGGRSRGRWWLPVGFGGLVVVAIVGWAATSSAVDEVETVQPTAAVTAIEVDLDAGAIRLASGDELSVEVARRAGRFAGTPTVTTEAVGGVLRISGTCPTLAIGRCDTSVALTLPAMSVIDVTTGAGPIEGTLAAGSVRASTTAGPITLVVTGDVSDLAVVTTAGSVDLVVPDASYQMRADTEVGRVDIGVETDPDAERTIQADSEVGSIRIRPTE